MFLFLVYVDIEVVSNVENIDNYIGNFVEVDKKGLLCFFFILSWYFWFVLDF